LSLSSNFTALEILDSLKNTMTHIFDGHLLMPLAYPKTRPGQFGHEPWKESKASFFVNVMLAMLLIQKVLVYFSIFYLFNI
jgi:hypothetical protein